MQLKRIRARSHGLVGALYLPESAGPHPAVIVLGGCEGGAPERAAAELASVGFAAMAVAYFGVDPLPRELEEIPLEYFAGAFAWLARRPEVVTDRLSVIGRSRGGELALLLAARYPDAVKSVVAYAPSHVVWQSAPSSRLVGHVTAKSSWTSGGRPVPFVPAPPVTTEGCYDLAGSAGGRPIALRSYFERAMLQDDAVAEAAIPLERIAGPVLLLSGGDDQLWPSKTFCELALRRLQQHGHRYPHRHLCHEAAGHLFAIPGTMYGPHAPSFPTLIMGGAPSADIRASRETWPTVLDFLHSFVVGADRRDQLGGVLEARIRQGRHR